jgi:hypothetical protein
MNSQECPICIEKYTSLHRKQLTCSKCQFSACVGCYKKTIGESLDDPHCMNCNNVFDSDFLNQMFTKKYMKYEYKTVRGELLFNREQSYFAEALVEIEKEKKIEKLNHEIKLLDEKLFQMKQQIFQEQIQFHIEINRLKNKKSIISNHFSIRKCMFDDCKGLLEKRTGYCILCEKHTCLECNVIKTDSNHECKKEDIETWKMIIIGSKPCPRCATMLTKNGGCSQMWCPNCHVAFDWNTGTIETRRIHNPHYFEYIRQNGLQNINAEREHDECENVWNIHLYSFLNQNHHKKFFDIFRDLSHKVNNSLPFYRNKLNQSNLGIRMNFLKGLLNEYEFKKMLVNRELDLNKTRRIIDILNTLEIVCRNILNDLRQSKITIDDFYIQIEGLYNFSIESVKNYNQLYSTNINFHNL